MASIEPTRHPSSAVRPDRTDIRGAWTVSMLSVAWTLTAGCGAVAIGLHEASAALVAFGAVGLLDAVGSAALAYHFHHGLRHDALADHLEVAAHRVVVVGLVTVGGAAVVFGAVHLAAGHTGGPSIIGSSLAGASLIVLVMLARRKARLARRVGSGALRSDGHLSAVGATQAAVTLAGVATTEIGLHWADPLAAIAVGTVAVAVGAQTWRTDLHPRRRVSSRGAVVALAAGLVVAVAVVDALLGGRLILTGLLVFAPVIAAASLRPLATAFVGGAAVASAVALGVPNGIWLTAEHAMWVVGVATVATATTAVVTIAARVLADH